MIEPSKELHSVITSPRARGLLFFFLAFFFWWVGIQSNLRRMGFQRVTWQSLSHEQRIWCGQMCWHSYHRSIKRADSIDKARKGWNMSQSWRLTLNNHWTSWNGSMVIKSKKFWFPIVFKIWVWVNTYRYIFSGMNIHLPAILGFTRYQGFDPSPYVRFQGIVRKRIYCCPGGSAKALEQEYAMAYAAGDFCGPWFRPRR